MANLKSSKKDIRRSEKRRVRNASQRSAVRTALKKAKISVNEAKVYKDGMKAIVEYEKKAMISTKNHLYAKKSVSGRVSLLVKTLKARFKHEEQVI